MQPAFALDSFALLTWLNGEPGHARVTQVLRLAQQGQARVLLCALNLGEVLYIIERRRGLTNAQRTQALIESLPIEEVLPDRALMLDAAHLKVHHPISYVDAFVVALARRESAVILTGDPEFESAQDVARVEWLIPPPTLKRR